MCVLYIGIDNRYPVSGIGMLNEHMPKRTITSRYTVRNVHDNCTEIEIEIEIEIKYNYRLGIYYDIDRQ